MRLAKSWQHESHRDHMWMKADGRAHSIVPGRSGSNHPHPGLFIQQCCKTFAQNALTFNHEDVDHPERSSSTICARHYLRTMSAVYASLPW